MKIEPGTIVYFDEFSRHRGIGIVISVVNKRRLTWGGKNTMMVFFVNHGIVKYCNGYRSTSIEVLECATKRFSDMAAEVQGSFDKC